MAVFKKDNSKIIGYFENKSLPNILLLVNEARAAVMVLRPPAYSKQQQTGSSGQFVSFRFDADSILYQLEIGKGQEPIRSISHLLLSFWTNLLCLSRLMSQSIPTGYIPPEKFF